MGSYNRYRRGRYYYRFSDKRRNKKCNINKITTIKDSGDRTVFETGAVRDMHGGKGRMDLLPLTTIIELSKHCEEGAMKYGEHNIDKGIPQHSLCDSGMRHLTKYMRGDMDENHLRAACWNLMWASEQSVTKPELNDLPWANKEEVANDLSNE